MMKVSTRRWPVKKASNDPAHVAVELILLEKGYTKEEARLGVGLYGEGLPCDRGTINQLVKGSVTSIEHFRDDIRIGTDHYQGRAYFWAYKYRFWMRGDAHGNGYKGIPIERARIIHQRFLDEDLDLNGETQRHDEIVDNVFGMNEYTQEGESE
jgi:hypothetical protein